MKKLAIGCLTVVVLVLVVGGVLGYIFVWRPATAYVASFRQLGELTDIDKQIANKSPFTAPAGNELTEAMVTRFVTVQEQMQQSLGARFADMKTKYDELDRLQKAQHRDPSFIEAMGALKDLTTIIVVAKRAQVEALNKAAFSLEEYTWVRGRVYNAAGIALSEMDLTRLASAGTQGGGQVQMRRTTDDQVPDRNKELVKPYAARLGQWAPLAFFGL
jgi:hypothetical protein